MTKELTTYEVIKKLGISKTWLYDQIYGGKINPHQIADSSSRRKYLFSKNDLKDLANLINNSGYKRRYCKRKPKKELKTHIESSTVIKVVPPNNRQLLINFRLKFKDVELNTLLTENDAWTIFKLVADCACPNKESNHG